MSLRASASFDPRHHVGIHAERVTNVSSTDFPGHFPDEDNSWNLEVFKKKLQVKVQRLSGRSIEFDLVGVDASIANAFRRILIAEVPTVCIEHVYVWNNTTVIHDEILAHRLGLIPLNVDPAVMTMKETPNDQATDRNTLVFRVEIACTRNPEFKAKQKQKENDKPSTLRTPSELYIDHELRSSHLTWIPQGEQAVVFALNPPAPTNGDIVLAKLRPGQEVNMECHAVKGIGKDHAKFSPVATASYRLHPLIILSPTDPVPPEFAHKFASCFPPGIIEVNSRTNKVSVNQKEMRRDTVSREVLRHTEFKDCVKLARIRDHFIFNVESEGPYAPERLLLEAIKVMRDKIARIRKAAEALEDGPGETGDVDMADA